MWLQVLVENFLAVLKFFLPFSVHRVYQRGVVFRWGLVHRIQQPGLRWHWPCKIEQVDKVYVAQETQTLMVQSATTKDDVAVAFSMNLVFRIVDPEKYITEVFDFAKSLDAYSMTHLFSRVRKLTYAELIDAAEQKKLEDSLTATLSTRLKVWGAEIDHVGFTDLVRAKAFRVFSGDGSALRSAISTDKSGE